MSSWSDIMEYSKLVCEMVQKTADESEEKVGNKLSEEILNINSTYTNTIDNTIKSCEFINSSAMDILEETTILTDISVGRESAPLLVSLKELGDEVLSKKISGCDASIEEKLQNNVAKMEENQHCLEDFVKDTNQSISDLTNLLKVMNKRAKKYLSVEASNIESFSESNVVASSPINLTQN